ncbi:MAG: hypothetical protein AAF481_05055 [Acidobacteriota bacterium]
MTIRPRSSLFALPIAALVVLWALPLILGDRTLFLRDTFNTHLEMKAAQAEALRDGRLPWIDPYRAGGQPLLANPNTVALYPDAWLLRGLPLLWHHNAHFWLHLLLAPFAMAALGRAFGLPPPAAWAAAACWTFCGWTFSLLNLYNLVAAAALTPALCAAAIHTVRGSRRAAAACGLLWGLLIVSGDPLTAALSLALALAAARLGGRSSSRRPALRSAALLGAGVSAGTLLALPQIVEFLRILPLSFRGHRGYGETLRSVASFDPRQTLEWLLPFAFGRPDVTGAGTFWGHAFYTDTPPLFFTLYPGILALALVVASGRPRGTWTNEGGHRWAWLAIGGGVFFALGRFNPVAAWLLSLGPSNALRYPIKLWLAVALGAALLAGFGYQRAFGENGRARRALLPLGFLGLVTAALWVFLSFAPEAATAILRSLMPRELPDAFVASERIRWAGLALLSTLTTGLLAATAWLTARRPNAGALLLTVHGATQLFFLAPVVPMDDAEPYRQNPELLVALPADGLSVHGDFDDLFGRASLQDGDYPEPHIRWWERRAFEEVYPFTGALWERRFDLNASPEGLDSFLSRSAQAAVAQAGSDVERIRLLASWGVDRLLLTREPEPAARALLRPVAERPGYGKTLRVWRIVDPAPEVFVARRVLRAPHMNAARAALGSATFDPQTTTVLPGEGGPEAFGTGGEVRVLEKSPTLLRAEIKAPDGGVLVWQRAHLPLFEAEVDGEPADIEVANLHRMAVEVPPGEHRVEVRLNRRPFYRALVGTGLGALGLLALLAYRKQ